MGGHRDWNPVLDLDTHYDTPSVHSPLNFRLTPRQLNGELGKMTGFLFEFQLTGPFL